MLHDGCASYEAAQDKKWKNNWDNESGGNRKESPAGKEVEVIWACGEKRGALHRQQEIEVERARKRGRPKAVFTPHVWNRNDSRTVPVPRVHTCSTASTRSGSSRPPRDVIAVERFRNRSGWLCGVNGQLDPFRNESSQRGRFGSLICACLAVDLVLSTPLHKNVAYFIGK